MSVGEVLDFIYTYIKMRSKNTKQNNNQQKNMQQEDAVCYGRVDDDGNPMSLEQIMAMEWWEQKKVIAPLHSPFFCINFVYYW